MKSKVNKYTITQKIASGGMGAIYKAKHPTLNRDVILKELILKGSRAINERFKREAQFMIDFRNEHIVQVFDHFKEGQSYYIVMEYVDGITLSKLIEKNRYLPNEIALTIFYEICRALNHAHERGVIHRDIKPDNVLISREGVVKLTDFGIATSKDAEEQGLTKNMTLGTPAYMSPEQITDSKNVDKRADIYSCGVVLYEMVTGKCPFPGNFTPETVNAIHRGKYLRPRKVNPKVSPAVQKIIKKAMHHNKKRRYRDMNSLIAKLSRQVKMTRDQEMIKETLRAYIYEGKHDFKKTLKGFKNGGLNGSRDYRKIVLTVTIMVAMLAGGFWYGFKRGFHHEVYQADQYGALQIDVRIRNRKNRVVPRYILAELFRKGSKRYIPVRDVEISFARDDEASDDVFLYYRSPRLYLKSDQYRVYIDIDENLYQRDIFVKPREIQKQEKASNEAQVILVKHFETKSMPLDISYEIYDGNTGNDITKTSEFFIRYSGRWVLWESFLDMGKASAFLKTGKQYYFKIQHENYYNRYLSITVDPHQSKVDINTDLQPLPGSVFAKSNIDGPEILINNMSYYTYGGSDRAIVKLDPLTTKYKALYLSPGIYYFTARVGAVTKTESIEVIGTQKLKLIVLYNDKTKSIEFKLY